uniref:Uncharacterized protein n=1 Tax=Avena sativa TaxID=4498 RepID=A0ACD5ZPE7_AVESA
MLLGLAAASARFQPRPSDVFLASFLKSGTTWLKALAFATRNRAEHPPRSPGHPLRHRNPHDDAFGELPSPRLLATHIPYPLLPARVAAAEGGGRILYICRDPKDALVSMWLFTNKKLEAEASPPAPPYTIEDAFELFCDGRAICGPQWRHVAGYWEASQRMPEKVLFLRYEEMLREPEDKVRKLAEFMGCAFSDEEVATGVVKDIVDLCSIDALKNMEVNKTGSQMYVKNETFFRKGVAGDWSNHMTAAMAERLDKIVEEALRGSGFTFSESA